MFSIRRFIFFQKIFLIKLILKNNLILTKNLKKYLGVYFKWNGFKLLFEEIIFVSFYFIGIKNPACKSIFTIFFDNQ